MKLFPLPAFQDYYLWVLHDGQRALVVDPGDAQPVLACLQGEGLQLDTILVTHAGAYRTHEYTSSNLKFARIAEPGNLKLINYQYRREESREQKLRTSPRTIAQARETSTHSCTRAFRP